MVTRRCSYCNSSITRPLWRFVGEQQFCSVECKNTYFSSDMKSEKAPWIQTACEYCATSISITPRNLVLKAVHFCSTEHQKLWLKEQHGIDEHYKFPNENWQKSNPSSKLPKKQIVFQGVQYEVNSTP